MATTIWDGHEFREVEDEEAKALVKEDKAQIVHGLMSSVDFKHRDEFTGYANKMMSGEAESKPKPKKKAPTKKKD